MAGAGYKLFATGDVLSASDVNTYIMQQTVMVFASSAARTTALSSVLAEGMVSYLKDTNVLEVYDGSAWVGATGDITGLTAGTGVSITSATGPVPTVGIDTAVVPQLGAANTFTTSPQQINGATSAVGLIVKGNATTPGNLQEWQNSSGTIFAKLESAGHFRSNRISASTSGTWFDDATLNVTAYGAAVVGAIVRGASGQSANLQQWQNSAATVLASIDANGSGRFAFLGVGTGVSLTAMNNTLITSASLVGVIVKGAASQTADLQQWQNSAGTVLAYLRSDGLFNSTGGVLTTGAFINANGYIAGATLSSTAQSASSKGLIVKGAVSQTANLTEWQNSSGTNLATVRYDGVINAPEIRTSSNNIMLREENSGGFVNFIRETAAGANPGANQAKLYFRDGTTAGTLKLVVRAGAAGAETTILDNIPQ